MSNVRGPTADTRAGDAVVLPVSPDGPFGVVFLPDADGCAAVIDGFDRLPNGKFGPVQRHGGIHVGDVLFEINDTSLMNYKFQDVMKLVADRNILKKEFKFINSREYYRRKRTGSLRVVAADKNNFYSAVRRSRTTEEGDKQFTEYEIACQFRVSSNKVQTEIVHQWSVWKRYSELEKLHQKLKVSLGWQLDSVEFPPARTFTMNKMSGEFVEQRKSELAQYWQTIMAIDSKITEFTKHHCNQDLKEFLDVEETLKKQEVAPVADMIVDSNAAPIASADNRSSVRRGSVRPASRRVSLSKAISVSNGDSTVPAPLSPKSVEHSSTATAPVQPPTPPPRPTAAPIPPPVAAAEPAAPTMQSTAAPAVPSVAAASGTNGGTSSPLPPKASGARMNLLSSINALRKD